MVDIDLPFIETHPPKVIRYVPNKSIKNKIFIFNPRARFFHVGENEEYYTTKNFERCLPSNPFNFGYHLTIQALLKMIHELSIKKPYKECWIKTLKVNFFNISLLYL